MKKSEEIILRFNDQLKKTPQSYFYQITLSRKSV
ncbi:hypothetical protein SAMN05421846_10895 [Chryseobacterium taeanense]|uniref:Uncharacterized protein n=1 Tax=Chryseobacterium taeanense TaxID=311334 RepID=A0A1G8KWJ6_9FLAO|nr:hypothetical protein SAMN05421846_10895 [Chryseobacterium taeanense]